MNIRQCLVGCKLALVVASFSSGLAESAWGQKEGWNISKVEGTLEQLSGYQMRVKPAEGESVIVTINPQKTDFDYVATAEPLVLVPGLMVRFTAPFDPSGQPQATLKALEIFNPARKRRMSNEYMRDQTPGIYPIDAQAAKDGKTKEGKTKDGEKADPKSAPKSADQAASAPGAAAGTKDYRIVGKLAGIQGDVMQVVAGNLPVMIQLDKELTIAVMAGDPMFCVPGDLVEVTGLSDAANPTHIEAEKISVTGVIPLGSVDQQEGAGKSKRGRQDKAKKADADTELKPSNKRKPAASGI